MWPKIIIIDRDNCLNVASDNPSSPLYYITSPQHLILKPGVKEAMAIIKINGVPTILATKQRCISKGVVGRKEIDIIHARLERMLDFSFDDILVEPELENKLELYRSILDKYPKINPQDFVLFDDSIEERSIAARLGISACDGIDLYKSVAKVFSLK